MTRRRAWQKNLQDITLYYRLVKMLQIFFHWSWILYVVMYFNEYVCTIYLVLNLRAFSVRWFRCSCWGLWWEETVCMPMDLWQGTACFHAGVWIDWPLTWCVGFRTATTVHLENLRSSHYFPVISDGAPWRSFTDRRGLYDSLATSRLFHHILLHLRSLLKKLMIDGCSLVSTLHL